MKEDFDAYHKYLEGKEPDGLDPELQDFLQKMEDLPIPKGKRSKEDIWAEIEATVDETDASPGESRSISIAPWLGIAATLLLLLVFKPWQSKDSSDAVKTTNVVAQAKETKPVLLPDSSLITMNALSRITYQIGDQRDVELEGEAFFDVTKGDQFTVTTSLGEVQVLGTSFNVYAREDQFRVACKSGKVRVTIPSEGFDDVLLPGDQVRLDSDTVLFTQIQHEFVGRWQTGEFYFEKRPLREVLAEISRQYDVSIDYDSLEGRTFTGYFIKEDIELALTMVCEPLDLTYEIATTGQVVVKAK